MSSIPNSPFLLVWGGDLVLEDRAEIIIPPLLTIPYLVYECVANTNSSQIGSFIHTEFLPALGWSAIDRYPIYRGKSLVKITPGLVDQFRLTFVPYNNRSFPLSLSLKIWRSTMPLSRSGDVSITSQTSSTATATLIESLTTQQTFLDANSARKGATIWNASNATLYLELGNSVSSNDYTVRLGSNDYFEIPYGYTGVITGIWSEANGSAMVRELI